MKVIAAIVDELPTEWEGCMFGWSDEEGCACCMLMNDAYCHLIAYGKCPVLFKKSEEEPECH